MRYFLRHPVLTGIGFEILLSILEIFFSMRGHKWPGFVLAVGYLHFPAALLLGVANGLLGLHLHPVAFFWLCGALTAPIWIALLFMVRTYVNLGDRVDSRKWEAEKVEASGVFSHWRGA